MVLTLSLGYFEAHPKCERRITRLNSSCGARSGEMLRLVNHFGQPVSKGLKITKTLYKTV